MRREPAEAKTTWEEVSDGSRFLIPWLLLFAGSGCAALIYEIVWLQLLQLVIGSSAVSLGLLLATYMGGLCLGSLLLPRLVSARQNPLRVYAVLELAIGAFAVLALFLIPLAGRIYLAGAPAGLFGVVLRGVIAAICLLPPTILMGASLPAAARSVETAPRLGLLYSANIGGSVIGCLLAGFYLLRVYDMGVATYTGFALNVSVAGIAYALSARRRPAPDSPGAVPRIRAAGVWWIYAAIAFSGLTALGAEVVWTRLLSLLLGATVYTFSIILAVFLLGLWAGSGAGSFLSRRVAQPQMALAACQILLAAAIAWTAFSLSSVLPYWPVDPWLSTSPWFTFDLDITRTLRTILPAALLWGASFPLALAAAVRDGEDPAYVSGEIYAVNTLGSIIGALAFSLLLIPTLGTRGSQQVLICLAAAGALAALGAAIRNIQTLGMALAAILLTWILAANVAEFPWQAIAYGRRVAPVLRGRDVADGQLPVEPLFVGEGVSSSIVIAQRGEQRFFYVSGKSEASSAPVDMRLQRMMGHLPALFHPNPRSVLVIGFGAGVTAGSFVPYPEVQNVTICELESLIPPASGKYFAKENYNVIGDRRVHIVHDDARHYVSATPEKFDVITTDPIHPWVKGTAPLYSKEFFELEKTRLNPGGVVAQWLPLYDSDEDTVKTVMATFFEVFPKATVWSNFQNGDGYDLVLLGRPDATPLNVDVLDRRLHQPSYSRVAESLGETGFHSAVDLLATYAGRAEDLQPMLAGSPINEDLNLRLQYMAGLGLNSLSSAQTYKHILSYRRFPDHLLTGTGENLSSLRSLIEKPQRTF
jgi:spermidine synthase